MQLPFALPDWAPLWAQLALLLPVLLYALAFLFMPFSVIGMKTRLESLEGRLDDLQAEIRQLAVRLPAAAKEVDFEEVYTPPPTRRGGVDSTLAKAPIRPPSSPEALANRPEDRPPPSPNTRPTRSSEPPARPTRSEPRLDTRR
jgi:hypothetical protein